MFKVDFYDSSKSIVRNKDFASFELTGHFGVLNIFFSNTASFRFILVYRKMSVSFSCRASQRNLTVNQGTREKNTKDKN